MITLLAICLSSSFPYRDVHIVEEVWRKLVEIMGIVPETPAERIARRETHSMEVSRSTRAPEEAEWIVATAERVNAVRV